MKNVITFNVDGIWETVPIVPTDENKESWAMAHEIQIVTTTSVIWTLVIAVTVLKTAAAPKK